MNHKQKKETQQNAIQHYEEWVKGKWKPAGYHQKRVLEERKKLHEATQ